MTLPTYNQPVKALVRKQILEHAVLTLTKRRSKAPIVRADEFQETLDYAKRYLRDLAPSIDWLDDIQPEAESWLAFHRAQLAPRRPQELRVLYLCGPEPLNDLQVLLSLGVLPQNMWAIENDKDIYRAAVEQLKRHSSFIRVHHGNLDRFFEQVNERFDIVYIDACGPLPGGKPNTLNLLLKLLHHERLAPMGVLITNFAEPSQDRWAIYAELMAQFFSPRYDDYPEILVQTGVERSIAQYDPTCLRPLVLKYIAEVYSEFVTRFVVNLACSIIPQRRISANLELRRKYFADAGNLARTNKLALVVPKLDVHASARSNIDRIYAEAGDVYLSPSSYPIVTFLRRVADNENVRGLLEPLFSGKVDGRELQEALLPTGLIERIIEGHWEAASPELLAAIQKSWFDRRGGIFCDVPMPNLMVNSLFGIYGHPYLVNPRASRRVAYVAKSTRMYTDCLLLDQCRYYFDFWPTIDLVPTRFENSAFQLVLRACLDRMGRHDWSNSSHPFRGAALGGFGEFKSAEAYEFEPRAAVTSGENL